MRERPILFSGSMVRALLAGTKTQTRRVVKPQPRRVDGGVPFGDGPAWAHAEPGSAMMRCPYGKRGDRLWVRESWRESGEGNAWHYAADGTILPKQRDKELQAFLAHRAPLTWESYKWRPSIHMPRAASRITLEITGVRVERLQDISEADAIAEGLTCQNGLYATPGQVWQIDPRKAYRDLWEQINGPGSWDANPWVWVVDFRRMP